MELIINNLTYKNTKLQFCHRGDIDKSGIGCIREIIINDEYNLYKYKNKKTTFLDIGGNHGLVTVILAIQNPESIIYVLEPLPSLIEIIKKNIEINKLKNVIIINKGLGDGSDVSLYEGNSCSGASSTMIVDEEKFINKQRGIKNIITNIKTITFDDIIKLYDIKEIELLKIDCEGGEYFLYDSEELKKNIVKNITGEFHNLSYNKTNPKWNYTDLTRYIKQYINGDIKLTYLNL